MITRTAEQDSALEYIQSVILSYPDADELVAGFDELLANVPAADLDREINNLGHCLMLILKKTAPDMPETIQYGLPFAFAEILRERNGRNSNGDV